MFSYLDSRIRLAVCLLAVALTAVHTVSAQQPASAAKQESAECRTATDRLSGLRLMAVLAKCRGDSSLSFSLLSPDGEERLPSLESLLRKSAVYVATATRIDVLKEVIESDIYTWQVLRVEQTLASAAPLKGCHALPASVHLEPGEIAVPMLGGTAVIEGVTVSLTSSTPSTLKEGQRYLAVGDACGKNVVAAGGTLGMLPVNDEGALKPLPAQQAALTPSLRTVPDVQAFISQNRK